MDPTIYVCCFHQKNICYILSYLKFNFFYPRVPPGVFTDLSGGFSQVAGGNFRPREFWFWPNALFVLHTHRLIIALARFENIPRMPPAYLESCFDQSDLMLVFSVAIMAHPNRTDR